MVWTWCWIPSSISLGDMHFSATLSLPVVADVGGLRPPSKVAVPDLALARVRSEHDAVTAVLPAHQSCRAVVAVRLRGLLRLVAPGLALRDQKAASTGVLATVCHG